MKSIKAIFRRGHTTPSTVGPTSNVASVAQQPLNSGGTSTLKGSTGGGGGGTSSAATLSSSTEETGGLSVVGSIQHHSLDCVEPSVLRGVGAQPGGGGGSLWRRVGGQAVSARPHYHGPNAAAVAGNNSSTMDRDSNRPHSGTHNDDVASLLLAADGSEEEQLQQLESLRQQLASMAGEKLALSTELGEHKQQLGHLHAEMEKMRALHEQSHQQMEQLCEENALLRNRLRDVAHSPLSDNEKQQLLLYDAQQRHHSSAPASIAANAGMEDSGELLTVASAVCGTPEWDKHSSSNVSEVSVACLQDKINQMQETHYSTNEELQATLQELTDLQRQLVELQQENERLLDEKSLMFESLCRQTERLNEARTELESLKQQLQQHRQDESGGGANVAERERQLRDAVHQVQGERDELLARQQRLDGDVDELRAQQRMRADELRALCERVHTLQCQLDAKNAERKHMDDELQMARDQCNGRLIEINRLRDLLDNARTKIHELEQDRTGCAKSELEELLDAVRKEKDLLDLEMTHMREQLALAQNEAEKLRDQVSILQEECKVVRNNAKTVQTELQYQCQQLLAEQQQYGQQLQHYQELVNELQLQTERHMHDKRELNGVLTDTQRHLADAERKIDDLQNELEDLKRLRNDENEEWEKFQNDLLTSVRVANDFKTEAQQDLQKLVAENKAHRDRVKQLESQVEQLKASSAALVEVNHHFHHAAQPSPSSPSSSSSCSSSSPSPASPGAIATSIHSTATRPTSLLMGTANNRSMSKLSSGGLGPLSRQNTRRQSVKSLIESIENGVAHTKNGATPTTPMSIGSGNTPSGSSFLFKASPVSVIHTNSNRGMSGDGQLSRSSSTTSLSSLASSVMSNGGTMAEWSLARKTSATTAIPMSNLDMRRNSYSSTCSEQTTTSNNSTTTAFSPCTTANGNATIIPTSERKDPLNGLVKNGGSKRNALLKWCQNKTVGYRNIDITNFSSSWNDGLALCALLHTYLPEKIPYDALTPQEKRRNFSLAFAAAESVGIATTLNIHDMVQLERPDWQQVMSYVTAIYKHFEI